MISITARYDYTETEAVRGVKEASHAVSPTLRRMPWSGGVLFLGTLGYLVAKNRPLIDGAFGLIFGTVFMAMPALVFYQAKRQFRQRPERNKSVTWTITEETLKNEMEGATGTFEWRMLVEVKERAEGFLLFSQPRLAHWIPKHAFASAEDIEAFRGLIRRSEVKHSGGALGPGELPQASRRFRWLAYSALVLAMALQAGVVYWRNADLVLAVLIALLAPICAGVLMLLGAVFRENRNPRARTKVVLWTAGIFIFVALSLLWVD